MKDLETLQGRLTCTVAVPTDRIDAGAPLMLGVVVSADPPADLSGRMVEIVDDAGKVRAAAALASDPGPGRNPEGVALPAACDIAFDAPHVPGSHDWTVRIAAFETAAACYGAAEAGVPLTVTAHAIAPVVWDVPQALAPGQVFTVRIGARCGQECRSADWSLTVRDGAGRVLATGAIGDTPWKGTAGLHYSDVNLTAPEDVGLATWEVTVEAPDAALPHLAGRRSFGVRTTPPADARLRVEAVDAETGAPVAGLKVVVHPFSASTGPDGAIEVRVPGGDHRVFVSGKGYVPARVECRIDGTETVRVALVPDRGLSDIDMWA